MRIPKPGDIWAYQDSPWRVLVICDSAEYINDSGFYVYEWSERSGDIQISEFRRWTGNASGYWELIASL